MPDNLLLPFTLDRAIGSDGEAYEAAVYVYNAGTSNEKNVYTNATLVTAADNPVLSDSGGWFDARFIGTGSYKLVFYNTNGSLSEGDWTLVKTADNLPGALDTSSFLTGSVIAETPVINKSANYTILTSDQGKMIVADPTGGGLTLTLPSAITATDGWRITIKHAGTANNVTIATVSSQTINGDGTSRIMYSRDEVLTLVSDGANWHTETHGIAKLTHGKFFMRTETGDGPYHIGIIPFGQCRLAKDSSNLKLSPFNGNLLTIDGKAEVIPDAGVTLSVSGLSNSTLYYVYAYMDAGVMTLEAVATAYTIGAGTGIYTKTGATTRTLVGMCYLIGGAFVDSVTQRFVRSWFNDPGIVTLSTFTANRTTTSTSFGEFASGTEIRTEFLTWSGEVVHVASSGGCLGAGDIGLISCGFDGTTAESVNARILAGSQVPYAFALYKTGLTEGYHDVRLLGKTASGTLTVYGSATASDAATMRVFAIR